MTYEQMKLFVAIAHSGTISEVAEKNNISHSAISRSISNLESTLGVTLFKRTRKGSFLTSEGEKAVELAQQIISLYEQMETLRHDPSLIEDIHIGTSTMESSDFIFQTISDFKSTYPEVTLHFSRMPLPDVALQLRRYEIDMGLSFFVEKEYQKIRQQFKCKKLLTTRLVVLFNPRSPLAQKSCITPADLGGHQFVLQDDPQVLSILRDMMGTHSFSIFSHFNQDTIIKQSVSRGSAVTFSAEAFIQSNPLVLSGGLKYAPIQQDGENHLMHYVCYYLPNKPLSLTKTAFVKFLEKTVHSQYLSAE